jgi:hypothetical protein
MQTFASTAMRGRNRWSREKTTLIVWFFLGFAVGRAIAVLRRYPVSRRTADICLLIFYFFPWRPRCLAMRKKREAKTI